MLRYVYAVFVKGIALFIVQSWWNLRPKKKVHKEIVVICLGKLQRKPKSRGRRRASERGKERREERGDIGREMIKKMKCSYKM